LAAFTTWNFELEIADLDRGVYVSEKVSVAQHPSETTERLVVRVLAYALEWTEGIRFGADISTGEAPAVWVHDLTQRLDCWVDVGAPAPERVHRATKAAPRVVIYTWQEQPRWWADLRSFKIFSPERLTIVALSEPLVAGLAAHLERRNRWSVSRTEGILYVEANGARFEGTAASTGLGRA